jgi:hypothetical protein
MATLINDLTGRTSSNVSQDGTATTIKPEDVIYAGATDLHGIVLEGAELSAVRQAFSNASASVLVCAFVLAIAALPFAYFLQWKVHNLSSGNEEPLRNENERVEGTRTWEV